MLCDMVDGTSPLISTPSWSSLVWQRAWTLEDAYWASANLILRENDILVGTMVTTKYLVWWQIADDFPQYTRPCEIMAKLTCHTSRLKGDDCWLKGLTPSHRTCSNCNTYIVEDVRHVLTIVHTTMTTCPSYTMR